MWDGEYKIKHHPIKNIEIIFLTFFVSFPKNYIKSITFGAGPIGLQTYIRFIPKTNTQNFVIPKNQYANARNVSQTAWCKDSPEIKRNALKIKPDICIPR